MTAKKKSTKAAAGDRHAIAGMHKDGQWKAINGAKSADDLRSMDESLAAVGFSHDGLTRKRIAERLASLKKGG